MKHGKQNFVFQWDGVSLKQAYSVHNHENANIVPLASFPVTFKNRSQQTHAGKNRVDCAQSVCIL